ncbi:MULTISPECIES: N-acetyltransferase [Paenibacillus]|uniref:GNAT family N-acetyltransferase n=1 Tax=Paenibacillus odorifer TaxID=189426 RepID=A0A1R0X505_9BACL|nr:MULTISPECIES: N-acetyltransferase [Paenibacillus]AWV36861.1 GNAT family N-acetyltransferase [Paenibacillus odorifer]MEC0133849.1 N-acetyltransferase [Paenibacillus odorifer]MEC0221509.1 N-acetyltransferase [Paenibacillus odorifer]OMC73620.1 GNAT family N-acetyltransferase [Paenibacillus odorifer]OMC76541.1 GNAT family N-acetyltransferase [Paenibacillus odorifer]
MIRHSSPAGDAQVICRNAVVEDVEPLYLMIEEYAQRGIMLPRSRQALTRQIDQFVVAEIEGRFVGCGSLFKLGNDLVEIRSIGLNDEGKGKGVGSMILAKLVEEARNQKIPKVMALTYAVDFFLRNGFEVVQKEIFPEKVWTDCVNCKKQHACDEIAVLKILN